MESQDRDLSMSRTSRIVGLRIVLFSFLAIARLNGETIRIAGSDYARDALVNESLTSGVIGSYTVEYQMSGSLIGLIKLREGYADVVFALQTVEGLPSLDGLTSIPLGFWGIYFAVQEENPLSEVSLSGVSEILRKSRDGLKSEWGALLPQEPKWVNRLIYPSFDVKKKDASFPLLLKEFFNNEIVENYESIGEKVENLYLATSSNLLVLSQLPEPGKGLRVLSLIQPEQSVGFPPTGESMHFGDYPLRSTLYLAVQDPKSERVRAFVRNFFESNSLELLGKNGLVRVSDNVQKQALLEFDLEF